LKVRATAAQPGATLTSTATTTYSAFGLSAATAYEYRVTAYTSTVATAASNTATVTTLLTAPTNFTATATSPTNVNLAWSVVAGATSYQIQRSTDGSTWSTFTPASPLTGSSTSTSDTTALAGTTYYYRISSVVAAGNSAPSTAVVAPTYAIAPTLTAITISSTEIDLSWTSVPSAFSYKLETSTDGGTTWSILATQTATTYNQTGLTADTSHKYRVSAINAAGTSAASTVATNSTLLNPPTGFSNTVASTSEVDLSWIAVTDATSYKLERSTDNVCLDDDCAGITDNGIDHHISRHFVAARHALLLPHFVDRRRRNIDFHDGWRRLHLACRYDSHGDRCLRHRD
jgi:fibronectin type 3 domain-containing protein